MTPLAPDPPPTESAQPPSSSESSASSSASSAALSSASSSESSAALSSASASTSSESPGSADGGGAKRRSAAVLGRVRGLVRAIQENDDAKIEQAILRLSRSRRWLAPLALAIGAFALLFQGLKLLVSNWRLTVVQILPAMWIWLAMFDLKAHVLHGKTVNVIRGPVLIPIVLVITAITIAAFFLNSVFAFAISQKGQPQVRPAVEQALSHRTPIAVSGGVVGLLLAFSTMIVTRWGPPWFGISLGITVGLMMVCYVAVPSRLIGVKPTQSRRDKLTTSVVGGVIGATVCTPPYVLGRVGLLMLGSKTLFIPGIFVFAVGITLQAGATGAVRAIKMSASLTAGQRPSAVSPAENA